MTQTPSRDWQKDMERVLESRELCKKYGIKPQEESIDEVLAYWLQEAKERGDRVQRLKEEIEYEIELLTLRGSDGRAEELRDLLSTLYPDTPAPEPTHLIKGVDTTGWTWHTPAPKEGSS